MQHPDESREEYEYRQANGIRYLFRHFHEDLGLVAPTAESFREAKPSHQAIVEHFRVRHGADAADRMERCQAAFSWFEKHRDELDVGDVAVCGDAAFLWSPGLAWALWSCWCRDSCDFRAYDPDAKHVITFAGFMNKLGDKE